MTEKISFACSQSLLALLLASLARYPKRRALWVNNQFYTYADLFASARRIAAYWQTIESDRVAILAQRSVLTYCGIIAALLAGKTFSPLNPDAPPALIAKLLMTIDTDSVLVDSVQQRGLNEILSKITRPLSVLSGAPPAALACLARSQHAWLFPYHEPRELIFKNDRIDNSGAWLLFTSGSTGQPKGVCVSQQNALHYINNIIARALPHSQDRFSQLAPLTFDFAMHDIFVAWSVGACVYVMTEGHLLQCRHFFARHPLTFWASVPSTIRFLQQTQQLRPNFFPSLRHSIFCGEVLTRSLLRAWQRAAPRSQIDNLYGPTEATIACTGFRCDSRYVSDDVVSIGFPFSQQRIRVIDHRGKSVLPGQVGELCLAGPQVVKGYWRQPTLTAERFVQFADDPERLCWYRSQDLVRWSKRFGLIWLGRLDDQFKVRGCCVLRSEVEQALMRVAHTSAVAVLAWPPRTTLPTQKMIAFVAHSPYGAAEILARARKKLLGYCVPDQLMLVEQLPRNHHGKIDYQKLYLLQKIGRAMGAEVTIQQASDFCEKL